MTQVRLIYIVLFAIAGVLGLWNAWGGALDETRCCVAEIARDADGKIARRADVLRAFRDLYPCPATGLNRGRCDGWNLDHVLPLACGGFDAVSNLQWLPVEIKRCPGDKCKDRFERRIYCQP